MIKSEIARGVFLACIVLMGLPQTTEAAPSKCDGLNQSPQSLERIRKNMLAHLNAIRRRHRLPTLKRNSTLDQIAQGHAEDIAEMGRMSHFGSDGSTLLVRADRAGYTHRFIAENVGYGQTSVSTVVDSWMLSTRHKAAILHRRARDLGSGFAIGRDKWLSSRMRIRGCYWVMVVGAPRR